MAHDSHCACLECKQYAAEDARLGKLGGALRRWWKCTHGNDSAVAAAEEAAAVRAAHFTLTLRSGDGHAGLVAVPRRDRRVAPRLDRTVMSARRDEWNRSVIARLPLRIVEIASSTCERHQPGPLEATDTWEFSAEGVVEEQPDRPGFKRRPWVTQKLRYLQEARIVVAVPDGSVVARFAIASYIGGDREVQVREALSDGGRGVERPGRVLVPWATYGRKSIFGGSNADADCYDPDFVLVDTTATSFDVRVRHQMRRATYGKTAGLAIFRVDGRPRRPP